MNILLINSNRLKHPWPVIPFGLCSVAAVLEKTGYAVHVLDLCFSKHPEADIRRAIEAQQSDVIGISIRNIDNGAGYKSRFMLDEVNRDVITPCKRYFKGPIVIGGPAVGISGAEMLSYFDLPYAVHGDGERTMVEFVDRLAHQRPLNGIGGLISRLDGRTSDSNPPWPVDDMNSLPFVTFDRYVDIGRYRQFNSPLQIQTKRGCALNCTYCTYNRIEGSTYRLKDPQKVAEEIETLVSETGIRHIEFTDSTFNIPLTHSKAVLQAVAAKNLGLTCRTMGLNPSAIDEELAELMSRVGFNEVDLGVESGCDITLRGLGKNFKKTDVLRAGRLLQAYKIPTSWFLLVGAPGETVQTLEETFHTIADAASPWDLVVIGVGIRVYKGSPISATITDMNTISASHHFLHPVTYGPADVDIKTIKVLTKRAVLKQPNFLTFEEDIQYPEWVIKGATLLLNGFAKGQPLWRVQILVRKILHHIGVDYFRLRRLNRKHAELLARVRTTGRSEIPPSRPKPASDSGPSVG